MANQTKATFNEKGLEWLAANVVPIESGEVLPQLMAIGGFETNSRVLFTDLDSADSAASIESTHSKDGPARFIASPETVSGARLTAQEYFAALYLAGEKVLTALGQPSDYTHPAILSIFRSGWAKFIALPIKLLEELRKAAQAIRTTAIAA